MRVCLHISNFFFLPSYLYFMEFKITENTEIVISFLNIIYFISKMLVINKEFDMFKIKTKRIMKRIKTEK